jgi:hypothetical protein
MDKLKKNIDIAGFFTSGICAIHCMALPILISFGLFEGLMADMAHGMIEWVVYGMAFIFASTAVYNGWQKHSNILPSLLFLAGFIIISIGMYVHTGTGHLIMAIGGSAIALGHLMNFKLLRPVQLSR